MKMYKKLLLTLALLPLMAAAQIQPGDSRYSISLHAGYGHNRTYGSMGNFDIDAFMPINQHFEMQADIRMSTANFYSFGVQMRPKFALPVGEMFLEDRLMARLITRDAFNEVTQALSLGYRMQYVSIQLGMSTRLIIRQPYEWHSTESIICEPFNVLYRVEGFVRPQTSPWNISLCVSNMDNYQIERVWQPMFMLGSWYDPTDHWRVRLYAECKPTGMFHLNATYYGAEVRVGAEYRF